MEMHTQFLTFILLTAFVITAFGQNYGRMQRTSPRPNCRWGSVGECIIDGYCPAGSRCQFGRCCRNMPGTCPPPSGRVGICVFIPGVNCLSNESCGRGQLCCSEGCGKVCKDVINVPDKLTY